MREEVLMSGVVGLRGKHGVCGRVLVARVDFYTAALLVLQSAVAANGNLTEVRSSQYLLLQLSAKASTVVIVVCGGR